MQRERKKEREREIVLLLLQSIASAYIRTDSAYKLTSPGKYPFNVFSGRTRLQFRQCISPRADRDRSKKVSTDTHYYGE